MRKIPKISNSKHGGALIPTIMFTGMAMMMVAGGGLITSQQTKTARRTVEFAAATSAAEAELERLWTRWRFELKNVPIGSNLSTAQVNNIVSMTAPMSVKNVAVTPANDPYHTGYKYVATSDLLNISFTNAFITSRFRDPTTGLIRDTHDMRQVDQFGQTVTDPNQPIFGPLEGFERFVARRLNHEVRVASRIRSGGSNLELELVRTFTKAETNVFWFGLFSEDNMELHPGEQMLMAGPVFSNKGMYAVSMNDPTKELRFSTHVTYNEKSFYNETLPDGTLPSGRKAPIYTTTGGKSVQLNAADKVHPGGREFRTAFDTLDTNTNNDGFRELIEKPDSAYPEAPEIAPFRFYNQAHIRVVVNQANTSSTTQTVTVYKKNSDDTFSVLTGAAADAIKASFKLRRKVYDSREGYDVAVTPIYVNELRTALESLPAGEKRTILYVTDESPTNSNPTSNTPKRKAFRLENATKLPTADQPEASFSDTRGFAFASDAAVYIKGDFNTDAGAGAGSNGQPKMTVPAAIFADAVTILSNQWSDANASAPLVPDYAGGPSRQASATTVNVNIATGHVPGGYVNQAGNTAQKSGGIHNLARYLENWNTINLTFKGSLCQLWNSKVLDGVWNPALAPVYYPPNRNYSYNERYLERPSPGSFSIAVFNRGPMRRN